MLTDEEERKLRDELEAVLNINENYSRMVDEMLAEKWAALRKKQETQYEYGLFPVIMLAVVIILGAIILLGPLFNRIPAQ